MAKFSLNGGKIVELLAPLPLLSGLPVTQFCFHKNTKIEYALKAPILLSAFREVKSDVKHGLQT